MTNQSDSEFEREFEKTTRDLAALIVRAMVSGVELAEDIRLEAERNWTSILTTRLTQLCELQAERLKQLLVENQQLRELATKQGLEISDADIALIAALPVGAPDSPPLAQRVEYLGERLKQAEDRAKQWSELFSATMSELRHFSFPGTTTDLDAPRLASQMWQRIEVLNQEIEAAIREGCRSCGIELNAFRTEMTNYDVVLKRRVNASYWDHSIAGPCSMSRARETRYQREQQGGKG